MSNYKNKSIARYAEMFQALSNPNRLEILLRLIFCCPPGTTCTSEDEARRYVGELAADLSIAPSTVSHHIKELRRAGLITVSRSGKNIECRVDPEVLRELGDLLAGKGLDKLLS